MFSNLNCEACDEQYDCNYNRENKELDCTICCQANYLEVDCACRIKGYCLKLKGEENNDLKNMMVCNVLRGLL